MTSPAEQASNFEVLTPTAPDDYLKATFQVLGKEHAAARQRGEDLNIDGLIVAPLLDGKQEHVATARIFLDVDGESGYEARLADNNVYGNYTSLAQLSREEGEGILDASSEVSVQRIGNIGSRKGTYQIIRTGEDAEGNPTLEYGRAQTDEQKERGATMYATMASDFKGALTAKLQAARPDLLDGINATERQIRANREKGFAAKVFGKVAARNQIG